MYRLLVVHEDPSVCKELMNMLDWHKYGFTSLVSAGSYAEALGKAMDAPPHVALISVRLGDQWGWELEAQLRAQGFKTVCAMVSERGDLSYMRRSLEAFVEETIVEELGGALPRQGTGRLDPVLQVEYQSFHKITNKILLYTRSNYRSPLSLVGIAEVLKMNSKYIGRVFTADTGMKYSEYLTAYRMLQARKLILGTQNKISVIANMVGYSQLNNFYIHFKQYFGMSPGDLRKGSEKQ